MFESIEILIVLAIFVVAILYSSVGHDCASDYLAVMALLAVTPGTSRPAALVLISSSPQSPSYSFIAPDISIRKFFCRSRRLRFRWLSSAE
ncbi:MAG: hypothetical protein AVDCRST_MAG74-3728 [uncultured Pyrinomonadaceae bacterium]|uniref:Uncharacterized protein n=1 Tax=uncultured Pyrinomonadaceae bacterium TaxID=2283094 RepID=A0A6J4PX40_9BACT|nr:MAG: hypothetical protein AVDCRST_MAG74-3728 [uncultured Pyrinomonadaceae bacterium]